MSEPLTVVLLTYERTECALRTIKAATTYLQYPGWRWYVADDGSRPEHFDAVLQAVAESGHDMLGAHTGRLSYGAGANQGVRKGFEAGQLVLMLEDDWELTQPFDVWKYAALLMERPDVGMVRTGYLNAGLQGSLISHGGSLYWRLNDKESKHFSSFAFAGHPALIHHRFFDAHDYYPERWQPGDTELRMCWQVTEHEGPAIVWPVELGAAGPWAHIGSVQSYTWNGGAQLP